MDLLLIKNGIIMAAIGTLLGIPFMRFIGRAPKKEEQFRIAHLAGILGGVLLIALGAVWLKLKPSVLEDQIAGYGSIVSNWLFLVGLIISSFSGKRGLSPKSTSLPGKIIFGLYSTAALISTIGTVCLIEMVII